jgi:hypothetical protein
MLLVRTWPHFGVVIVLQRVVQQHRWANTWRWRLWVWRTVRATVNIAQRTDVLVTTAMVAKTLHRQSPTRRGARAFRWYAGADIRATAGVTRNMSRARPFLRSLPAWPAGAEQCALAHGFAQCRVCAGATDHNCKGPCDNLKVFAVA